MGLAGLIFACALEPPAGPDPLTPLARPDPAATTSEQPEPADSEPIDTGHGTTTTPKGPRDDLVQFIVIGDAGDGSDAQYRVADAIEAVCATRPCSFGVYTGDVFYGPTITGVDDEQWQTDFELPYANLDFPFYGSLGNHDYWMLGDELERGVGQHYVDYSDHSDRWIMHDLYYGFTRGSVDFFALDTNEIYWMEGANQAAWLDAALAGSTARWKIVFGHHPYRSNGTHGSAGAYDGMGAYADEPGLDVIAGVYLEEFFETTMCERVDLYLCGHDHNLQWLEPVCGMELIVSGAGGKASGLVGGEPARFQHDDTPGFTWIELGDEHLTAVFYDDAATVLYEATFERKSERWR